MSLRLSHLMTLTISLTWVAEIDLAVDEVRALAQSRHCRRERLVPALLQKIGHAPPAPAAVPGAVHEHEGLRRAGLRRCWRAAQSGCARAGACACQHAAAGHRYLVGCSHRVLPTRCFWLNLTRDASLRPEQRKRKTLRNARLPTLPAHPPTLWITGTIRRRPVSVRRGPILGGPANHSAGFMRFPPQFLDELRARLPVSEVVGRRVRLKKAGREWKGLSPFNKEKTPSFFVNDQKMAWFDFSSGKNGSIFDFVMMTEGLTFPEAVERLAAQAGIPLPRSRRRRRPATNAARRSTTSSSWRRNSSRRRWRRVRAPRRAAISPTADSIRRRRSSSASAMPQPSASRSRSISATRG